MSIPKTLIFKPYSFVDGFKGFKEHLSRCEEYGITMHRVKESRDHDWRTFFTVDNIPDKEFNSNSELLNGLKELSIG